jgi:RNase adaptor protein for sRNA GlmZ degradation
MDIGKFVDRRLHPVRVAMGLMNHEMELARGESTITLDREMLRSLIETVSLFVEDFEVSNRALRDQAQKKFAQAGAGGTKVG